MEFRSKVDSFFMNFMLITVVIIGAVTLLPLFLGGLDLSAILILGSTFILTLGFILWCTINIKYVFHEDVLFIKGGPFTSRIRYEAITKIAPTSEILTGYRILTSRDALEIFYNGSLLGSVKISPNDKVKFINELKKRCPHLH